MKTMAIFLLIILFPFALSLSEAAETTGFRVIKDGNTGTVAAKYQWEILPSVENESGIITAFAADGNQRCAVGIRDHILIFEKTNCIAAFRFETSGSYTLSFLDGQLVVHANREQEFLAVDLDACDLRAFRLDPTETSEKTLSVLLKLNPGDPNAENGYFLTNTLGNRNIRLGYDTLIYVEESQKTTVYKTYTKIILEGIWLTAVFCAASVLLSHAHRKRRNRNAGASQSN